MPNDFEISTMLCLCLLCYACPCYASVIERFLVIQAWKFRFFLETSQQTFVSEFSSGGVIFARYNMLLLRYFWSMGHCRILMQVQMQMQLDVLLPIVGNG